MSETVQHHSNDGWHIASIINMIGLDSHTQFSASQNFLDHESPFAACFQKPSRVDRAGNVVIWLLICLSALGQWQRCHRTNSGRARGHAEEHEAGRDCVTGHSPPRGNFPTPRAGNVQIAVMLSSQQSTSHTY